MHAKYLRFTSFQCILILSISSAANYLPFAPSSPIPKETPEPIDIITSEVKRINTSPLILFAGLLEQVILENSGHTVKATLNQTTTGTLLTGGVLYTDIYIYWLCKFYWSDDLKESAGTTVNGKKGTPLEIGLFYYNQKYGSFREALNYRDGLAEIIVRINVGPFDNLLFEAFKHKLKQVRKAEATTQTITGVVFIWYALFPPTANYFAYPGSYLNESSGQLYYCTTTIVVPLYSYHFISQKQFESTFGKFLRDDGTPLTNKRVQKSRDGRPVVQAAGVIAIPTSGINPFTNVPAHLKPDDS